MARFTTMSLLFVLGWAFVCAAQPSEERTLVDEVSATRLGLERLSEAMAALEKRRAGLAGELENLSAFIQQRKQNRSLGGLIPDFGLEASLRRAQAISQEIEEIDASREALNAARLQDLEKLAGLLQRLIEQRMENIKAFPAEERGQRAEELLALLREIENVHRQLAVTLPTGYRGLGGEPTGDDPERLREQADSIRDAQDRLRRDLAETDRRIAEAESELKLERAMREFLADQELFGEDLRTLRASRLSNEPPKAGGTEQIDVDGNYGSPGQDSPLSGGTLTGHTPLLSEKTSGTPVPADPAQRLKSLRRYRQQLVERLKALQLEYDRLQERIEQIEN